MTGQSDFAWMLGVQHSLEPLCSAWVAAMQSGSSRKPRLPACAGFLQVRCDERGTGPGWQPLPLGGDRFCQGEVGPAVRILLVWAVAVLPPEEELGSPGTVCCLRIHSHCHKIKASAGKGLVCSYLLAPTDSWLVLLTGNVNVCKWNQVGNNLEAMT